MSPGPDTTVGKGSAFPETPWSLIVNAHQDDEQTRQARLNRLFTVYWRPMYKYVRIKWGKTNEETKDLIQGFCIKILEGGLVQKYESEKSRFRTFVRAALDNFVRNENRDLNRLKRGGRNRFLSLEWDESAIEKNLADGGALAPEESFDKEWNRALIESAVERIEKKFSGEKQVYLNVFRDFESDLQAERRPAYDILATRHGITKVEVSNHLQAVKRALRQEVIDLVRETVADEESLHLELSLIAGGS
jgi:RNA polymerase sigma-70 factor (ECF subfamily)